MRPLAALLLICGLTLVAMAGAVVWFAAGWRTGWFSGPPPIARNMYPVAGQISPTWSRRLRERFPIGSAEKRLVEVLRREKFQVDPVRHIAGYGWARYPCVYTLTVVWRADEVGRVRAVQGGLLNACTRPERLAPQAPPRPPATPPSEPVVAPGAQSA
jgi:hypothetical protein